MINNKIKRWNQITSLMIILILAAAFLISLYNYKHLDFTIYINNARVKFEKEREQIERGIYPESEYPYIVFDTSGKVLFATSEFKQEKDDTIVVDEMLQMDQSFAKQYPGYQKCSLVLNNNSACVGFVVYLLQRSHVVSDLYARNEVLSFLPIGIGIILSIILLILRSIYCNLRILKPLQRISSSSQAIIAGNYDIEVLRVYDNKLQANEIGDLTYSFELMRDELKAKQISEQAIRKSQQELISCISHDLRTPISTIKAYSEGIRDGIASTDIERQEFLSIIINKTNLLEGMISELLEYSNTQLNQMDIQRKEVYFQSYIKEITRELRIYIEQRNIQFECTYPEEDFIISIDQKRITEVLYNLIENSMKYMDSTHGFIQLITKREKGILSIHIIDNGIGISAEDIPYVFDKFYRAEKSRSSNVPGSGLGLSICKYIINQHDGEIYCRSRKSNGSEFWFTLSCI